jgi:hypothetical protein
MREGEPLESDEDIDYFPVFVAIGFEENVLRVIIDDDRRCE